MTSTQFIQDLVDTLMNLQYHMAQFNFGRQFYENEHSKKVKRVHDLVHRDKQVAIRQIVEDTVCHIVCYIIRRFLDAKL